MSKKYKQSRFNITLDLEGKAYLYNSLSGAVAEIDDEEKKSLDIVCDLKTAENQQILDDFKKGGFIVDDDFDEIGLLKIQMNAAKNQRESLNLTIAPTSDCNFRCIYCYEKDALADSYMNDETAGKLIEFIKHEMKDRKVLSIAWYGGEPLLSMDTIEKISKPVIAFCEANNYEYHSSIITNGYLLSPDILNRLKACHVEFAQITLDGSQKTHDKRRFLKGGYPTYKRILQNLAENKDNLIPVTIRVNIDRTNVDALKDVRNDLDKLGLLDYVSIYPGHVESVNGCYMEHQCISNKEFSDLMTDFNIRYASDPYQFYPRRVMNCCGADDMSTLVIGPDGTFYKCWDDIGRKEKNVGNLYDGRLVTSTFVKFVSMDATTDEECKECFALPICMGGCPNHFFNNKKCSMYKYTLERNLKECIRKLAEQENLQESGKETVL